MNKICFVSIILIYPTINTINIVKRRLLKANYLINKHLTQSLYSRFTVAFQNKATKPLISKIYQSPSVAKCTANRQKGDCVNLLIYNTLNTISRLFTTFLQKIGGRVCFTKNN